MTPPKTPTPVQEQPKEMSIMQILAIAMVVLFAAWLISLEPDKGPLGHTDLPQPPMTAEQSQAQIQALRDELKALKLRCPKEGTQP